MEQTADASFTVRLGSRGVHNTVPSLNNDESLQTETPRLTSEVSLEAWSWIQLESWQR